MPSRRKHSTLDYETPSQMSVLQQFDRYRWLFWPLAAVIFLGVFLTLAGDGAAAGVYELIVHVPVLVAWLLSAFGWGVLLSWVGRSFVSGGTDIPVCVGASAPNLRQEQTGMSVPPKTQDDRQDCPPYQKTAFGVVTTIAIGLGAMSLVILGLGLVGAMNRPIAVGMILAGVGIAVWQIVRSKPKPSAAVDFVQWPFLLLVPLTALVVLCALLPAGLLWGMDEPNGYDVVGYHLQVPREWYESGRITGLHHNVYSYFPFNVEMHYLLAMHLMGGPWKGQFLAQLMHASYMGLTVAAVYGVVRSLYAATGVADASGDQRIRDSRRGVGRAVIAALLAAAPPWMPMLGAIAYNEGGFLLYGTLAIGWLFVPSLVYSRERAVSVTAGTGEGQPPKVSRTSEMLLAGVMSGFAAGCKLTAVPLLLVGIPVAVLILNWRQWKGVAVFVIAGLLTFSPWLIRNAVWTGNPVFPEMQSVLGRGHFSPEQSARWHRAHKPRPDQQAMSIRIAELGRQVLVDWRFAFAVVPLGVIAVIVTFRERQSRLLLYLLMILTGFWLLETHLQGRFYVLAIPIAALAIASVQVRLWAGVAWTVAVIVVLVGQVSTFVGLDEIQTSYGNRGIRIMPAIGVTDIDSTAQITGNVGSDFQDPIVLVGDAKAFFYQLPMKRLHYRTVFDVDTSNGRALSEAYTADLPEGTRVLLAIDLGELARFRKTYQLPEVDAALALSGARGLFVRQHVVTKPQVK